MKNDTGKCVVSCDDENIFNVYDFETYEVIVDFDNLEKTQSELISLTMSVDKECPFAKHFGISGVGEGIVWRCPFENKNQDGNIIKGRWIFKTKGQSHTNTKNSVLVPIDAESSASIEDFVDKVCTENRFDQAIKELYQTNPKSKIFELKPQMSHCKYVMTWIVSDILKEESKSMEASGIETKQLESNVGKKVAIWMRQLITT
jgi:hypothetical protein